MQRLCFAKDEKIKSFTKETKEITASNKEILTKLNDINELTFLGWEVIDGERERLALNARRNVASQYDYLNRLKRENKMYEADIRSADKTIKRDCSLEQMKFKNRSPER